ncbi:MAG TPA: PspC domain-containing protein [Ottowia sp.]|nr:PspC domain-containing protein [Ottowia sp.]
MSIADELCKLDELRQRGTLSDAEFARAKERLLGTATPPPPVPPPVLDAVNRLRRSTGDRWIGGVCGGLARATGLESWVWRLIFAVLILFGGAGIVIYLLLWIFVPAE